MSRARLGLYVFARVNLFKNCFELTPAFNILCSRPVDGLHLSPNEVHPTSRQANVQAPNPLIIADMPQMCKFVYDFYAQKVAALAEISRPKEAIASLEEKKVGQTKAGHKTGQHPADDRDSDDEMEGKKVYADIVNEVDHWIKKQFLTAVVCFFDASAPNIDNKKPAKIIEANIECKKDF